MRAEAWLSAGKVASFRMEVSRTTREARSGASQRSFALLASDEPDRLGLGHAFPAILVVRAGLCWGQLEPENLAANDGRGIHAPAYSKAATDTKRSGAGVPARLQLIQLPHSRVRLLARDGARSDAQPPSLSL